MTNRPNGTLYIGVTGDLSRRIWEHRAGLVDGFTKRYGLNRLVHIEHYENIHIAHYENIHIAHYENIHIAIQREKNMKHWPRLWKLRVIAANNPNCDDLYDRLI